MRLADIVPYEARQYVSRRRRLYVNKEGPVRVASDTGCCPISDMLKHPSVWNNIPDRRAENWKPVMDNASTVMLMLIDPLDVPDMNEAFMTEAELVIKDFCRRWDHGEIPLAGLARELDAY